MKTLKNSFLIFFLIIPLFIYAQVGIGTVNPNAKLDIQSTNQATPANTDGILIPKIDAFPLTNPTVLQDGMMVFVTGSGVPTKGFYYWDNPTTTWIPFTGTGVEKIDDLLDGKSDNDGTQDGSSVFLGINAGVNDDSSDNKNVGIGFEALQANTAGTGNIANGYQALYSNIGGNWNVANGYWSLAFNTNGFANTANGSQSLFLNTDGYNNTANGYQAIYSNTSGHDNTASGLQSLYTNNIGNNNTAYGVRSLYLNTEGSDNAATGDRSLFSNITGRFNTANGSSALFGNTIGDFNTATGYQSLLTNTEGINNVANGSRSLFSNTTGNDNTANGFRALYYNIDGDFNTASGSFSLFFNSTGNQNIGIGHESLFTNTTGSYNIGIGSRTGSGNSTGSNNIYLGHSAGTPETGSNKLYIENSGANADNALIYGEFDTNILRTNAELQIGNPSSTGFAFPTIDGTANQVLQTNGSGAMSWVDGSALGSEDADWYEEGTTSAPNAINDDIFTQGNVAIGKTMADYALDVEETEGTRIINTSLTGTPTGTSYSQYNEIIHNGSAISWGIYNNFNTPNSGLNIGITNRINSTNNGPKLGTQNSIISTGDGGVLGVENILTNNGTGGIISTNNSFGGTSSGIFFGSYNKANILAVNADIYGVYSEVLRSSGTAFSGFFVGKVAIGTIAHNISATPNFYTMPASRGIANQVMQTDGSGIVSWVDGISVGTDNQNISGSGFSGTTLTIGIENGTSEAIDLSSLQDGIGTDNQNISGSGLSGTTLTIGIENGISEAIDLASLQDGIGTDDQNLTGATLTGNTLQIAIENGTSTSVDLSALNTGGDITNVTAGTGLTGGGATGAVTLNVVATNGLTANANDIVLGGPLNQATTITQGTNNLTFNLNSTGDFKLQDNGTTHFDFRDDGNLYLGGDTYWRSGNSGGTNLARLYYTGVANNSSFELYKDALVQHQFNSAGTSVINELGEDFDFRIEGDNNTSLFYVDAGNDCIGIMENTPSFDLHLKQSTNTQGGAGGIGFENSTNSNNWKIYHAGFNLSFSENGIRRAYITGATGAYVATSDRRLKKSIFEVGPILSKVNALNTYRYLYKDQDASAKKTIGFMAQDVQVDFPELVETGEDGYLGLNYAGFSVIAIKAIQEQQDIIKSMQAKMDTQEEKIKNFEDVLNQLLERVKTLENKN